MSARIYHLALARDWAEARRSGEYAVSTRGLSLAEVGFIHACRSDQWQGVRERFYADVREPLVLLVIAPERLSAELRVEWVEEAQDDFPHLYGPLNTDAVVEVVALERTAGE